jgi:4-hydroxythreonine-4-phosphate dehydrogenase
MKGRLGISLGDVAGVGPEVTLKSLAAHGCGEDRQYLLIGDAALVEKLNAKLGLQLQFAPYSKSDNTSRLQVLDPFPGGLTEKVEPGSAVCARAAMAYLEEGAKLCLGGRLDGLVTAPVNKESIIRAGFHDFVGQTEFLSQLAGASRTAMMLLGHDDRGRWLRVALATTHLPIRRVADELTREKIELAIELGAKACADLSLTKSRIAVCGLNPHAGEGGKIGTEEITVVTPAVEACRRKGIDVHGPFAADALFHSVFRGDYEVVVAMYHDQGLAPLKMVAFESGINWTLGLPFIRTSPDHGTAYDIAGKGLANHSSMTSAINLAWQLTLRR